MLSLMKETEQMNQMVLTPELEEILKRGPGPCRGYHGKDTYDRFCFFCGFDRDIATCLSPLALSCLGSVSANNFLAAHFEVSR